MLEKRQAKDMAEIGGFSVMVMALLEGVSDA